MTTIKVINDTDVGTTLDISSGKLEAAASMTTDAELAAQATTQAVVDSAQDAALITALQASEAQDATEEQNILDSVRLQEGMFHNATWELKGSSVKAYTTDGSSNRLLSISSLVPYSYIAAYFPPVGATVPSLSGGAALTVDAEGFIPLPSWGVLWFKHRGAAKGWYWSLYFDPIKVASSEYVRVLAVNNDHFTTAQLSNGRTIYQGMNHLRENTSSGGKYPTSTRCVTNTGVFEGHLIEFDNRYEDFALTTISPDSVRTNTVVHFRLPITPVIAGMYHLHFRGHSYRAQRKIIDYTVAGYSFYGTLHHPEVIGTHAAVATQYVGSDNHVYVRVEFGDGHHLTLAVDSMGVGLGDPFKHGSIQTFINPAATL